MFAQLTSGVRLAAAASVAAGLVLPGLGAVSSAPAHRLFTSTERMACAGATAVAYAAPAAATRQMRLTVRDKTSGAVIQGARVSGYWYTGPVQGPLPTVFTNSAGLAVMNGPSQPQAYKWRIRIEAPGYVTEQFDRFANSGTDTLTRHLRRR